MSPEPNFVKAFGYVKKAAALANRDLGVLDAKIADAIVARLRPADRRRDARPVRHRLHPGRRRHVDQHERERGDRQPRARDARPQERRLPVRQPERSRELRAVDQRRLPDRVPAGADPAPRELHRRAPPAAAGLLRQGQGIRAGAEDGPHAPAGRRADVARTGVPRLGHDHRRGSAADRRSAPAPARDQSRRHRDRHDGHRRAGYPDSRRIPVRAHRPPVHPGRRPGRGDVRHRRLRAAVRRAEAHLGRSSPRSATTSGCSPRARAAGSTRSTCRSCSRAPRSCRAR